MITEEDKQKKIEQLTDTIESIQRMHFLLHKLKVENRLYSVQVARSASDYYSKTLDERVAFLGAPSTYSLCKTIIMENTRYDSGLAAFPEAKDDPFYHKYVMVITQFEERLAAQRVLNIMKSYQQDNAKSNPKISKQYFNFQFADGNMSYELTGYKFNAITPFYIKADAEKMFKFPIPIILAEEVTQLEPAYFWFGGGRVESKIGISVRDFLSFFGDRIIVTKLAQGDAAKTNKSK